MSDAKLGKKRGTFVDLAKQIKEGAVERFLQQRFVFHHVPKCGGTSVGRAFRKRYFLSQATVDPESSYRAYEAFTLRDDQEGLLIDVLDLREQILLYLMFSDIRCISAHVRFSEIAYARFNGRYKYVTILREPIQRFISHYNWSYGRSGAHAEITEEFDTFLESVRAKRMGAIYCEYFSGLPKEADVWNEDASARAISNLQKFDVVGRLDQIDAFTETIEKELGFKIRIGHENKDPKRGSGIRVSDLSRSQLEKVHALCAPDTAVWDAAPWTKT
ncbi:sulfotransferase family 2 domain-containing protein [Marivita sp. XM-24bin2]|jgi:hypothetical protein|uniref:sulfotransferase family 2 domain-containing protein n=1 Tax=unclassified Marivita TaxID=2632480 RepID=UPI000D7A9DAE|nr:sulfotransferase family 2 domain-containing protein [Marivita sp. XM-24bin2]MCR9111525.1 sulfotransferase family protein [Paracoccaceae bacterium]PWL33405.1 MAG: hypothetical protein DCO97_19865 [Marivita sp. XM-24bin2]